MKIFKKLLSLFKKGHTEEEGCAEHDTPISKCAPAKILVEILQEAGIRTREIATLGLEEMFEKWYEGKCNKKSVRAAMGEFFSSHGVKLSKEI
jgi:hypothetical protein